MTAATTRLLRVLRNPFIPHTPTHKQGVFLAAGAEEALFGGAAGGGKSDALLMGALQYVDVPGYAALLFRRSYTDLSLPGALMDRAQEWLGSTSARWVEREKTWVFPSGATLTFGYLQSDRDKYRYQSAELQYIGFDELTQFDEADYQYLFSRLRRKAGMDVPLRMRAASNPGGEGHAWVYERFVVPTAGRLFVPALLDDNPHIDREAYRRQLARLDDITRQQLEHGLWVTDPAGRPFQREWWAGGRGRWQAAGARPPLARWISWDTAFKDTDTSDYSAYTVGELGEDYRLRVRRIEQERLEFPDLPERILEVAAEWNRDGKLQGVLVEDRGSGTSALQTLTATAPDWLRALLVGYAPRAGKVERARQAGVWCKRGMVLLPEVGPQWLFDAEQELYNMPNVVHDDRTDSLSQLVVYLEHYLAEGARGQAHA